MSCVSNEGNISAGDPWVWLSVQKKAFSLVVSVCLYSSLPGK